MQMRSFWGGVLICCVAFQEESNNYKCAPNKNTWQTKFLKYSEMLKNGDGHFEEFLTWFWSRVLVCGLYSHGESRNGLGSSRKNSGQTIFLQSLEKTIILRWSGTEIFPSGYPIFSYIWCLLAVRFTHEFLQNLLKLKNNSSFVSGWILVFSFMGKENT